MGYKFIIVLLSLLTFPLMASTACITEDRKNDGRKVECTTCCDSENKNCMTQCVPKNDK